MFSSQIDLKQIQMQIVTVALGMNEECLSCPSTKLLGPLSISSLLFFPLITIFSPLFLYQKDILLAGFPLTFSVPSQHQVQFLTFDPFMCSSLLFLLLFFLLISSVIKDFFFNATLNIELC